MLLILTSLTSNIEQRVFLLQLIILLSNLCYVKVLYLSLEDLVGLLLVEEVLLLLSKFVLHFDEFSVKQILDGQVWKDLDILLMAEGALKVLQDCTETYCLYYWE
jgi:hypothetical protein